LGRTIIDLADCPIQFSESTSGIRSYFIFQRTIAYCSKTRTAKEKHLAMTFIALRDQDATEQMDAKL